MKFVKLNIYEWFDNKRYDRFNNTNLKCEFDKIRVMRNYQVVQDHE